MKLKEFIIILKGKSFYYYIYKNSKNLIAFFNAILILKNQTNKHYRFQYLV